MRIIIHNDRSDRDRDRVRCDRRSTAIPIDVWLIITGALYGLYTVVNAATTTTTESSNCTCQSSVCDPVSTCNCDRIGKRKTTATIAAVIMLIMI